MKKRLIALVIVLTLSLFSLFAYIYGGTNFSFSGYPSFDDRAPSKAYTSYNGSVSRSTYESYKDSVEDYVEEAKKYIENANNDIKRIQEAQKAAIDKANKVVDEYNSWVKTTEISSGIF